MMREDNHIDPEADVLHGEITGYDYGAACLAHVDDVSYPSDAVAVKFNPDLLRKALERAETVAGDNQVWVVLDDGLPLLFAPENTGLAFAVAPMGSEQGPPEVFGDE